MNLVLPCIEMVLSNKRKDFGKISKRFWKRNACLLKEFGNGFRGFEGLMDLSNKRKDFGKEMHVYEKSWK